MASIPQPVTDLIEKFADFERRCAEAQTHLEAAVALGFRHVCGRALYELEEARESEMRQTARSVCYYGREHFGAPGMPLPAETFEELMPERITRYHRYRAEEHGEKPPTFDLAALWPAICARYPSAEQAQGEARAAVAQRFCSMFTRRGVASVAPTPHKDGIKLELRALVEKIFVAKPSYSYCSTEDLLSALDLLSAILREAGQIVHVGYAQTWSRERPYFVGQRLDLGAVTVLCRKTKFELVLGRDASRALNLFLAANAPASSECA